MGQVSTKDSDENLENQISFTDEKSSTSSFANQTFDNVNNTAITKFRDPAAKLVIFKKEIPKKFEIPVIDKNAVLVSVTNPQKIGTGINAYVLYKVSTKTVFSKNKQSDVIVVERRFRDFLALYDNFVVDHRASGHLIPPPPEKNLIGMTMVKITKAFDISFSFIEKRRAALERYLKRILRNPLLGNDPHLQEFLKHVELPIAERFVSFVQTDGTKNTMLGIYRNVQDVLASRYDLSEEGATWFHKKHEELDKLSSHFHSLHLCFNSHFQSHKNYAESTYSLSESFFVMASLEKQPVISRMFIELKAVFEKLSFVNAAQANADHYNVGDMFFDHLRIAGEVNNMFNLRHKQWLKWQGSVTDVQKIRESVEKLQDFKKAKKMSKHEKEADQLQSTEISKKSSFLQLSSVMKDDIITYSGDLSVELRESVLIFLNNMIQSHETILQVWESFLQVVS